MAYTPGFDYDIFVSFSHRDNTLRRGQAPDHPGWVECFVDELQGWLRKRGLTDLRVWFDKRRLTGATDFDERIRNDLGRTALFLVLHSHNFRNSTYCPKELDWFVAAAKGSPIGISVAGERRIFNVLINNISHSAWTGSGHWTEPLTGTTGFKFHNAADDDEEAFGDPIDERDPDHFEAAMLPIVEGAMKLLKSLKFPPTVVATATAAGGSGAADTASALRHSVVSMLNKVPLPDEAYLPHYRRTVVSLGNAGLEQARGVDGMVQALASSCDAVGTGRVPYGLIEFLIRLRDERKLGAPVAAWLRTHAADQQREQATARQRIEGERADKVLFVAVENNSKEDICDYAWFLRTRHLRPVHELPPGLPPRRVVVAGWGEFQQRFSSLIAALAAEQRICEIHFAVRPALFDRPFHLIPTVDGKALGDDYVVLVRYLDRLDAQPRASENRWRQRAQALREAPRDATALLPIRDCECKPPAQPGFCYTRFSVPAARGNQEKRALKLWLDAGFAYLSWFHEPPPGDWDGVDACYRDWIQRVAVLDRFPRDFTDRRSEHHAAARQATLLWDDPLFNPFPTYRGTEER